MIKHIAVIAALLLTSITASGAGPDSDRDNKRPASSVAVGDMAPELRVGKWLKGDEVMNFEPGKTYVVEFWAPWCGARIRHLPHFADLQSGYKDKGVSVIAFTSRDIRGVAGNTEDDVASFVKKRGAALDLRFAYAENRAATDAWLGGRDHFWTFIVDRTGRVAYAGSPLFVDLALSKVLAGGMSAKEIGEDMEKVEADYQAVAEAFGRDSDAGLRMLEEFEGKYSSLADTLPADGIKLYLLLKQGRGAHYAERLVQKATKQKNLFLLELACLHLRGQKGNSQQTALAVRAAEAIVRIDGGKDPLSLLRVADAHLTNGNETVAKEFANKALDAVKGESIDVREYVEKEARRLGASN